MNNENKEKLECYMAEVLFDAMRKMINQPITSVAEQIHWHRHARLGYLRKL